MQSPHRAPTSAPTPTPASSSSLPRASSAVRLRPLSPTLSSPSASVNRPNTASKENDTRLDDQSHKSRPISPLVHNNRPSSSASRSSRPHPHQTSGAASAISIPPFDDDPIDSAFKYPLQPLTSIIAPASLDEYIALQNQQSQRGLEVVYGLKVELSKLYEELVDRSGDDGRWGQPLPYRVMGVGGVLYWKAVSEGKIQPPKQTLNEDDLDNPNYGNNNNTTTADPIDESTDPFGTRLATLRCPPPPVDPNNILPAYVLVDRLKTSIRRALTELEDSIEEKCQELEEAKQIEADLRHRIHELERNNNGYLTEPTSPTMATMIRLNTPANGPSNKWQLQLRQSPLSLSSPTQSLTRSLRQPWDFMPATIAENDSLIDTDRSVASNNTGVDNDFASAHPTISRSSSIISPRRSPHAGSSQSSLGSAAEALLHRVSSNSVAARMYHQQLDHGNGRHSIIRTGTDVNYNTAREEALERTIIQLESTIHRHRETERRLRARYDEALKTHSKELIELSSKLTACENELAQTRTELTNKAVLLNLEAIARRQRQDDKQKLEAHFTHQLNDCEKEMKILLDPNRELLFVKRTHEHSSHAANTNHSTTAASTAAPSEKHTDRTMVPSSSSTSKSSKKRPMAVSTTPSASVSGTSTPMHPPNAIESSEQSADSKTNPSSSPSHSPTSLRDVGSELYPSPMSPLALVESTVKAPSVKQWLGKMLNNATTMTPVKEKDKEKSKSFVVSHGVMGHLLPGVDLLATDLLLVLDALFHLEYTNFTRASVELARQLHFDHELAHQHDKIRNATERPDMYIDPPLLHQEPTTADLAALLSSIPPASLAYLQAIQRIFLTLYHRLPHSLQQRFIHMSNKMKMAKIPNVTNAKSNMTASEEIPSNQSPFADTPSSSMAPIESAAVNIPSSDSSSTALVPSSFVSSIQSVSSRSSFGASESHSLARFELILHKIQAIATLRGILMKL